MPHAITIMELFLIAMAIILSVPYLIWRLARTGYFTPLLVVQIITGILLGPDGLSAVAPGYYEFVLTLDLIKILNGLGACAVMLFVRIAGVELDLRKAWQNRVESGVTAGFALGVPLATGSIVATGMLMFPGWIGERGHSWQFLVGVGMVCAVTALPILIPMMEKLEILLQPIGQRILRYASFADMAIRGALALVQLDWERAGRQLGLLVSFAMACVLLRKLMAWLPVLDCRDVMLIWLALCASGTDWAGLHFMVGAFLAGVVMDAD